MRESAPPQGPRPPPRTDLRPRGGWTSSRGPGGCREEPPGDIRTARCAVDGRHSSRGLLTCHPLYDIAERSEGKTVSMLNDFATRDPSVGCLLDATAARLQP